MAQPKPEGAPLRVLVVDDSETNRRTLRDLLQGTPYEVVGDAADGEEALKKALDLRPDVITLDLEMPRMGGFAFLRLLMANRPTPVIVISTHSRKGNVFKALELGALDFLAKPARLGREELQGFGAQLLEKLGAVRLLRRSAKDGPSRPAFLSRRPFIVAVGASTGGPPALQRLLEEAAAEPSLTLLLCQHMPPGFTRAFADRLDKLGPFSVKEAAEGDVLERGHAYVAPGGRNLILTISQGDRLVLSTPAPAAAEKNVPSVDLLFESVARVLGANAFGIVLTGMGMDGAQGTLAIHAAGGQVWAESEESAVIFGMPREAIATGAVDRVLDLAKLGPELVAAARQRR
jgi:two-component system, chemotaxis family, protein-glutamate methylesterase/glutaminase